MSDISGRVICITGVTAGIGRAVAADFAGRGAKVVGCGRRAQAGAELAEEVSADGGALTFVQADVSDPAQAQRLIDAAVEEHGRVDVLVNNAGGSGRRAICPVEEIEPDHWAEVLALNLSGTLWTSQAAIRAMRHQGGGGAIINIASVQGQQATAGMAPYGTAKAGVIHLTKTMAVELAELGIRANVIIMGGAATEAAGQVLVEIEAAREASYGDGTIDDYGTTATVLPEPLYPVPMEDIASALALLASDDARAITGASIAIDRGLSAGALHSAGLWQALKGDWQLSATA